MKAEFHVKNNTVYSTLDCYKTLYIVYRKGDKYV